MAVAINSSSDKSMGRAVKITEGNLEKYLGKPRYVFDRANETDEVGIVSRSWPTA